MQLAVQSPVKSLNKAYFKEKVSRNDIERFKQNFVALFNKVQPGASEDTLKDYITDFLKNTWYNPDHAITINKERKDFTIHTGKTAKDPVAVIAEVKKIDSPEMMTADKSNVKALHELVLYYLQERVNNNQIKYLLATDVNGWILIDANEFDKKIYRNTKIKKLYDVFVNDKKDNPFFYDELKRILAEMDDTITATYFNLNDYKKIITNADRADDKKLIALYKILSPVHLIKLSFANDSNSLDKNFYAELLHLIGLEEIKDGSKKFIQRKKESSEASLIENAIIKLKDKDCLRDLPDATKFGLTADEQYYNIALELCITWINRILFLKLLEAQLFAYHLGNKEYLFLNDTLVHDFDELNNLFLQVLAEKPETRRERLQTKFSKVPYLNSSLFERTELERKTIDISALDNELPLLLHSSTVLKDDKSKRKRGGLSTLNYLFSFLDSYDFTSEGTGEIQEENKALINASVLGLIFEKINGYKDGSFFTPGFITMYMCRETLRRAVVQKFNEANGWECKTFEELQGLIEYQDKEKREQANTIINSITICDPAVGSGHFLVSALNELITTKHDLKILQFRHSSQRIKEYNIEIVNDELIIQDVENEELFEYTLNQKGNIKPEQQHLQETLFHEKETLIENCLFGVDINANSVKICRLRLWIELLKNAYYTKESNYTQLETLPNIDINIKQGNSLISRFALDADLNPTLQKSKFTIDGYKAAVQTYRNAQSKEEKRQMEELIDTIKKDFRSDISPNDPINKKLSRHRGELFNLSQAEGFFNDNPKRKSFRKKEIEKLSANIDKLEKEKDDIKNNAIYKEAFEWRFEFPEVLDSEGKFVGFDVVIGNPPYGVDFTEKDKGYYKSMFPISSEGKIDSFKLFYELAFRILKRNCMQAFIAPNTFLYNIQSKKLREFLINNTIIHEAVELRKNIFEDAPDVVTVMLILEYLEKEEYFTKVKVAFSDFKYSNIYNDEWEINQPIPSEIFKADSERKINLRRNFALDSVINQMNKLSRLGNFFDLKQGTKPYGVKDSKAVELISKIKYDENWEPAINGRNIAQFSITKEGDFVKRSEELHSCLPKSIVDNEKIYFQRMRKISLFPRIIACYDNEGTHGLYTCSVIYPKKETTISLKYLLAILNSHLINVWYKNYDTDIEIKLISVKNIPIVEIDAPSQLPFINLVDKILAAKKENSQADTSQWESKIDELVYKLYDLTPEEIEIVKGNAK